jgi:hypothetical protein
VAQVDVPEVEALLRHAAERAREAQAHPDERGSPPPEEGRSAEEKNPPFGRNFRDA